MIYLISPSYGLVSYSDITRIIKNNIEKYSDENFEVFIGTDSQNFDKTKIVVVIAVHRKDSNNIGKGGFFFYEITKIKRIDNIHQKLITETKMSLECADKLMKSFENMKEKENFDYSNISFGIHVDIGKKGKTRFIIPEIVSWVKSYGYNCTIKPDSFAASSIADKISK